MHTIIYYLGAVFMDNKRGKNLFNKKDVVKTNMKTVEMTRGIGIIYVKGEMKFHLLRGMRK